MRLEVDVSNMILKTERLILRPFTESDVEDLYEYASVDGVGQMAGWPLHRTLLESKQIIRMFINGKKEFALVLKENQKVIG